MGKKFATDGKRLMYLLTYRGGAIGLYHRERNAKKAKDRLCLTNPDGCRDIAIEPIEVKDDP
jgi:hypothetical protein